MKPVSVASTVLTSVILGLLPLVVATPALGADRAPPSICPLGKSILNVYARLIEHRPDSNCAEMAQFITNLRAKTLPFPKQQEYASYQIEVCRFTWDTLKQGIPSEMLLNTYFKLCSANRPTVVDQAVEALTVLELSID